MSYLVRNSFPNWSVKDSQIILKPLVDNQFSVYFIWVITHFYRAHVKLQTLQSNIIPQMAL
jgi:hypothetical protein